MSYLMEKRINELKDAIGSYSPGSTFRIAQDRPTQPPFGLRIGLFGPTGVGKSALINSMNFVMGEMWENRAPEGFAGEASKTLARNAFSITETIKMIDNRGMRSLGGPFMVELCHQIAGVYKDEEYVEWDVGFLRHLVSGLERTLRANKQCKIHCAVLVVSALNMSLRPTDLKELIHQIRKMTGHPPVVVITHRKQGREEVISAFRTGLQQERIDYVYELDNYTTVDHEKDTEKDLVLLEALYQCLIVGDKVMKHNESDQGCVIL